MPYRESGLYSSFEEFERAELRQLDSAFVDEFNDGFFDDRPGDGLRAVGLDEDE